MADSSADVGLNLVVLGEAYGDSGGNLLRIRYPSILLLMLRSHLAAQVGPSKRGGNFELLVDRSAPTEASHVRKTKNANNERELPPVKSTDTFIHIMPSEKFWLRMGWQFRELVL